MEFVDGTLQRPYSGASIQRFAITWYKHLNVNRVNSWITWAVRHNVQQLSLYLIQKERLIITRSLFTCESLISLKLQITPDVRLPNYISFPKLKSLEIEGIEFSNEYWNEKLFSNCPVLEDFRMEHCTWFGMPNFCISTPALKHFKIDNWDDKWLPHGEDDGLRGCTLKGHAPNLETLYYNGSIAKEYVLTTFPLLVRAAVQFRFKPYVATRKQRISHGAAISQFLRALANIKRLFVSDDTLQALSFPDDLLQKLPTFHNTNELIMFEEVTAHKALVALLKATPNLKLLIFNKTVLSDDEEENDAAGSDAVADAANGENNHDSDDDVAGSDADAVEAKTTMTMKMMIGHMIW
ncbi:F-box/LRR-repeat protein At3g59190-like [Papaver somniferum]|uniref:F-box/LRR-repeat protein At3g59190-like n=1 Tax=Papaver somniferum TaxID=3469 RepID=UPI000E6F926D|nr:F-box/LRR-repeat protein At3g59190-like [Papaver somniferum]